MGSQTTREALQCYHCGDDIRTLRLQKEDKNFCCEGCLHVYELLSQTDLCTYYELETAPGLSLKNPVSKVKFNYLDDAQIQQQLIQYRDDKISRITFHVPAMHCSSCIWLLESLYRLEKGVLQSRVDFLKKQVQVTFDHKITTLRKLVELLSSLGYEPSLSLNDLTEKKKSKANNQLLYQVGVAGFCFGNIMLISFPEYFGLDSISHAAFASRFGYLNFLLALPTFLYSSRGYFISAWNNLVKGIIHIDFPLALGILVMFVRSTYEIFSHTGAGYFDTLAGLVFLLLTGKWVQQRTFDTLSFERDYKSYFPIAVSILRDEKETTIPVNQLSIGSRIVIRNQEIIPADSILLKGDAHIDFSFVTGESEPVRKVLGEMIYAGGRQMGSNIELEVCKHVSQSYLTQLWNSHWFDKENRKQLQSFQSLVSKYFTLALIAIAFTSGIYWLIQDPSRSMSAFTSVLIIACPCALALSSPFALGNALRLFGRAGLYLKGPEVIEQMAHVNTVIFDKTGTITQAEGAIVTFEGEPLTNELQEKLFALCSQSVHPLSKKIAAHMHHPNSKRVEVHAFIETKGLGIQGIVEGTLIRMGSAKFLQLNPTELNEQLNVSHVYIEVAGITTGMFCIEHSYRDGLFEVLHRLGKKFSLHLLSGDTNAEQETLEVKFPENTPMYFGQSPADKMLYVEKAKSNGNVVAMIGDGLNDAGALQVANVGISVSENTAHFSPASDAIMDAKVFHKLPSFFHYAKDTLKVIRMSFLISLCYNIIGLSYAVQGNLSPLIAAVLMPLSSITVIGFTTIATSLFAGKNLLGSVNKQKGIEQ